jgi:hypothetical protein
MNPYLVPPRAANFNPLEVVEPARLTASTTTFRLFGRVMLATVLLEARANAYS